MFIHVDFPSLAVLSVCAEGSGLAWNRVTQSKGSHVFGVFHRAWSWKAEKWRKPQKVEPWKRLSSARQLISSFSLWFHITFLLCFEHSENIIQIMLLEKKNLIITPSNEKMDTSEKCTGIVIFHILIHITRNRRETHAVYQIGLVPFAPSHAAHTDISFKYRLLAIIEQKSPCLPHGPGLECLTLPVYKDGFNHKAQINVVLWALSTVNCYWSQQMKFVHVDRSNILSVFSSLLPASGNSGGINK